MEGSSWVGDERALVHSQAPRLQRPFLWAPAAACVPPPPPRLLHITLAPLQSSACGSVSLPGWEPLESRDCVWLSVGPHVVGAQCVGNEAGHHMSLDTMLSFLDLQSLSKAPQPLTGHEAGQAALKVRKDLLQGMK